MTRFLEERPDMVGEVKFLTTDAEIQSTRSILEQLHPEVIGIEAYVETVRRLENEQGYKLVGLSTDQGTIACVAGFRICENLGWGRFLYVDDLATDRTVRSRGYGKILFDWLTDHAAANGCVELRLDSKVTRHEAHRFYLRERMDIVAFHFMKSTAN